ncbi:MAG: phosphoenolpyruvate--protein phosphotransferase [Desulfobacteraceae bacterium]|nr:MAG: phosphoenolpyruvate--protein phosphotransferase [Desulfobacteraceae bacterium]
MNENDSSYLELLFDISELADLVTGTPNIDVFLGHAVELVARHFNAPVCSIYLYNDKTDLLILKATKGLNASAVDRIHMKPGEGLIGHSFDTLSIVREGNASKSSQFKYFEESGEDPFNSFLCVPIRRGVEKIGVLAVQHQDIDFFHPSQERAIRAVVTQLAGSIENARLLLELSMIKEDDDTVDHPVFVKGNPAVKGYALGNVFTINAKRKSILYTSRDGEEKFTKSHFLAAVERTGTELKGLQKEFSKRLPESASLIFTAHFMILKDKNFVGKMAALIDENVPPCDAVRKVASKYISIFSSSPHAYMREKSHDVQDLCIRILNNFKASDDDDMGFKKNRIVIARDVFPSDILKYVSAGIQGMIVTSGGVTSHVTILARSLQLPLIITEDTRLLNLPEKTLVLIDADQGNIHVNPDEETIDLFEQRNRHAQDVSDLTMKDRTRTRDDEPVKLLANINLLGELSLAKTLKAEGIGLYRTEFPFLIRATFPSEAEQFVIYKNLLEEMGDLPVTLRTLDAGGEKTLAYSNAPKEANPDLGLRSIRFSLKHKDIFTFQIRAMLRAAAGKPHVRIMFPLISSIDEFMEAKDLVHQCMNSLAQDGLAFNRNVKIGIMIELPSVIETIDSFARTADFFSIGTNDFVQYMLAADRSNKMVADHYIPYHPAVNRGLYKITRAAIDRGIDVSVCGEMAHEMEYIPFLLGIGIRSLSIDPQFLPFVQNTIGQLNITDTEHYADRMLSMDTVKGARDLLRSFPWPEGLIQK